MQPIFLMAQVVKNIFFKIEKAKELIYLMKELSEKEVQDAIFLFFIYLHDGFILYYFYY